MPCLAFHLITVGQNFNGESLENGILLHASLTQSYSSCILGRTRKSKASRRVHVHTLLEMGHRTKSVCRTVQNVSFEPVMFQEQMLAWV